MSYMENLMSDLIDAGIERQRQEWEEKDKSLGAWTETCQTCNGHGSIIRMKSAVVGFVYTAETCPECNGTGEISYEKPQQ